MPKKIRELKKILLKAGFTYRSAKGSHTVSGKDGDDAKIYLEKEVQQRLKKLEDLQ